MTSHEQGMTTPAQSSRGEDGDEQHRRRFARLLLAGALVAYVAPFPVALWNFLTAPSFRRQPAPPLALGDEAALAKQFGSADNIMLTFGDKNVIILRTAQEQGISNDIALKAFNLRCTHAGCTVEWKPSEQTFVCHCHGGAFHADGSVKRLPPTEPLEELTLKRERDTFVLYDVPVRQNSMQ